MDMPHDERGFLSGGDPGQALGGFGDRWEDRLEKKRAGWRCLVPKGPHIRHVEYMAWEKKEEQLPGHSRLSNMRHSQLKHLKFPRSRVFGQEDFPSHVC